MAWLPHIVKRWAVSIPILLGHQPYGCIRAYLIYHKCSDYAIIVSEFVLLIYNIDGQLLRDDAGRFIAEFPGPPVLKVRIPEDLIDKRYLVGPSNLDKGK